MRHAALTIAALAVFAAFTPALAEAQTQTEMLEHIDDLGRRNEKLQERVRILESDNKALRERLRELGVEAPSPATVAPPITGRSNAEEQSPASRTLPLPPPPIGTGPVSVAGTIDLDSDPRGAQAATSLGSGCKTPCAMEISADAPFTVTFTHPGYAPATVDIEMQPGQPGVTNPKFSPNPVFVQLTPQSKKKPPTAGPQQLGPAR